MSQENETSKYLSTSYKQARELFLNSAEQRSAQIHSVLHPDKGLDGEDLFMDFAVLGPEDADDALILISGTHGIEGFCGSFIQTKLMNSPDQLTALSNMKIILLHAHNPYGFSWLRRTNENNVDMNRNYCDFDENLDVNEAYLTVKDLILPEVYNAEAEAEMQSWIKKNGVEKYQTIVLTGQRIDPDGIFYGDTKPAWSREIVMSTLPKLVAKQKRIFAIDIHTGLGPYGHGDAIHAYPKGSDEYERLSEWYGGEVIGINAGEYGEVSAVPRGPIVSSFDMILPNHKSYAYVIEYGTVEFDRVIKALRMDGWLHAKGDLKSEQGKAIKQEMRDCFYVPDTSWLGDIWNRMVWCLAGFYENA